jgi:molybdenum cofactor biosynthesis protein A
MKQLTDKYGRTLNYLRLSVTDRCNFRCYYCMPEEGLKFTSPKNLLTFEEMHTLCEVFCHLGVSKIRITGGEPFVRNGIVSFLQKISVLKGLDEITITTNGTLLQQHIPALKAMGIRKVNLSLDSLNQARFFAITRRDSFQEVYAGIFNLLENGFEVKLNCVLAANKNTDDIIPFIELTKQYPLAVRFLEEMPFNGSSQFNDHNWNYQDILNHIKKNYSHIEVLENEPNSTSVNYKIPGYQGSFGIIPSFSRTFCGTCNRIRLSATGELRTCLYGAPAANLRDVLRQGATLQELENVIINAVAQRYLNGYEAEAANQKTVHDSMSVLGG